MTHDAKHVTKEAFRKIILMKHKELLDRQTIDLRELICAVKEILYKYDNIRIIQDEPHNPDEEAPDTENKRCLGEWVLRSCRFWSKF
jgi:hypothetical protein